MAHKTSSFTAKILSGNKDEPASAPVTKAVSKISLPPPPTKKKRRQRVKNVRRHRKGKCTGFKPDLSGFDFEDKNPIVLQDSPAHDGSRSHTQCSCKGSEQNRSSREKKAGRTVEQKHGHTDKLILKKKTPLPSLAPPPFSSGRGGGKMLQRSQTSAIHTRALHRLFVWPVTGSLITQPNKNNEPLHPSKAAIKAQQATIKPSAPALTPTHQ